MIELHHLRHFLAVLEHGSINEAARQLHLSQPALTKSIQRLEELMGAPLFDRTPKPVPTRLAGLLESHARAILADLRDLEQEVADFKGMASGSLAVGAGPLMADAIMGPAIGSLLKQYPGLTLTLSIDEYFRFPDLLRARDIDLFIADVSEIEDADDLEIARIPSQPILFFCRPDHPILEKGPIPFPRMLDYPFVIPQPPPSMMTVFNKAAGDRGPFRIALTCSHYSTIKTILDRSLGISAAIEPVIRRDLAEGRLATIPVTRFSLHSNPGVVTLCNRALPPATESLFQEIQLILEETLESPASGEQKTKRAGKHAGNKAARS